MNKEIRLNIDRQFALDAFCATTVNDNEGVVFATGIKYRGEQFLSTMRVVELESKSSVHALGTVGSCTEIMYDFVRDGMPLALIAHSHPACGRYACRESGTDIGWMKSFQDSGASCIGLIFSRDGWMHFFSPCLPFQVEVHGNGIKQIHVRGMKNVYKLELDSGSLDLGAGSAESVSLAVS